MSNKQTNSNKDRWDLSVLGKITLISIILQAIVITILEVFVIYFHVNFVSQYKLNPIGEGISEADLIYHAIFVISLFFQVLLVIDAIWHRNSVQIVALVIFNLLSLAYAGIQLFQHQILEDVGTLNATYVPTNPIFSKDDRDAPKNYYEARMRPLEHTIVGLISVFSVYLAFMSYMLTKEFGWKNYKIYNADPQVRKALTNLTILQTLIKMDVFFIGSYALQLIPSQKIGYYSSVIEIALVFFFGTFMLLMAWFSVSMEMKYLLLSVINLYSISLIYWAFRFITINLPTKSGFDPYEFTRRFLTFFLVTTFVLVLITVHYSIVCFRNMMRGFYIFAVYGRSENEAAGGSPSSGTDNLESSKHITKKENAIRQHQIIIRQQHDDAVLV
ncbi:conserved fungal protein [Gigaspora margarita]|uniref:Conserved fungal protein n=1 Tax=Gigaspora margarita TaxID=4874 RepID=A0A8H4ERF4_GIGMA|nr:conserved fungal protein [Gigaspora margarita]